MYEVRECVQSLVDQVVSMVEGDNVQSVGISLSSAGLPDLVGPDGHPVEKVWSVRVVVILLCFCYFTHTHMHADKLPP